MGNRKQPRHKPFSSRVVLVTGASAGLGAQLALAFASRGALVIAVARRRHRLQSLCRTIRRFGGKARLITADLNQVANIRRVCSEIRSSFGDVDILLNNAAVNLEETPIVQTTANEWAEVLNTNLRAPFLLCREFLPGMLRRGYGRIVNLLSATNDLRGVGAYRISKIGLEVLTAALAEEIDRDKVVAVGVNPGWMRTEMSVSGRSPRGAARAIAELVTKADRRVNGQVIDLKWEGHSYRAARRRRKSGMFGMPS